MSLPSTHTKSRPTDSQLLVAEVESNFRKFMYMNEHDYTVLSLWVPHTHLWGNVGGQYRFLPQRTGRVYFGSNRAGAGKSQGMELTTLMSAHGDIHINPTSYGLISAINEGLGTNGVDEIDRFFGASGGKAADVQTILLAGYKSGSHFTRQQQGQAVKYNIHGPAVLAGKNLNAFKTAPQFDTMLTRSFVIELDRKPANVAITEYESVLHESRLRAISERLGYWGTRYGRDIVRQDVRDWIRSVGLANRDREIWTILFQIAQFIGGSWPSRIEKAARYMVLGETDDDCVMTVQSPFEQIMEMARLSFSDNEPFLPTRILVRRMLENPLSDGMLFHREWRNPQAASMGLAEAMAANGVATSERGSYQGKQDRGYYRQPVLDTLDTLDSLGADENVVELDEWDWSEVDDND